MRFHAVAVSASVSGDYYQLYLGPEEDEDDDGDGDGLEADDLQRG